MGVYIKSIKMPRNCDECPCYYETEGAWRNECEVLRKEYDAEESRPSWCPLVHIPPHGDLIDRDALKGSLIVEYPSAIYAINDAPTIIEAEVDK